MTDANALEAQAIRNLAEGTIAVIGLGYVGLPLAVEFGKSRRVIGFDVNESRINALRDGIDSTLELDTSELASATGLVYTSNIEDLLLARVYIVTVPSPIDKHKKPDLRLLLSASQTIGSVITKADVVIYESTVYPGCTEEDCIPVIERESGLVFNNHFFAGYSPERINPGDKDHRLATIVKVTSGSTPNIAEAIDKLYAKIVIAGTFPAASIQVAEAAKVIENTQRDLNIALINELAIIFDRLGICTEDVLQAARTKWNFLPFSPGLVGGHCIGVDPYYLTHKAETVGYYPHIVLAGRRLNDGMGEYVASQLVKAMIKKDISIKSSKVLVLGFTFKENCPDLRNTRVVDVVYSLEAYGVNVDVFDPWVSSVHCATEYGVSSIEVPIPKSYDAILLAVPHDEFVDMGVEKVRGLGKATHVLYDMKCVFPAGCSDLRL